MHISIYMKLQTVLNPLNGIPTYVRFTIQILFNTLNPYILHRTWNYWLFTVHSVKSILDNKLITANRISLVLSFRKPATCLRCVPLLVLGPWNLDETMPAIWFLLQGHGLKIAHSFLFNKTSWWLMANQSMITHHCDGVTYLVFFNLGNVVIQHGCHGLDAIKQTVAELKLNSLSLHWNHKVLITPCSVDIVKNMTQTYTHNFR